MKNPEHVAELLAELRTLAENDFERHRIDVLERDLHEPPQIEVIDDNRQKFCGIIYRQNKDGHFFTNHAIHRDVYIYCVDDIPEGYDVHHRDFDKTNNSPINLQLLSKSDHMKLHKESKFALPEERTCFICGKKFSAGKFKNFCSQTCWQKSKGIIKICQHCDKKFLAYTSEQQFCSHKCASAANFQQQKSIERICLNCGNPFSGRIGKFCSDKCYRQFDYKHNVVEKTCVVCGKTFSAYKYNHKQHTCSRSCAAKLSKDKKK